MALSTGTKIFLGVAGTVAVVGVVAVVRKPKPKKKKKKKCPEGEVQTGTNRDGTIICAPEAVCPPGEVQTGTKRDGTIICGPPTTHTSPIRPHRPSGLATLDLDVPLPAPEDPYKGQPWTFWPKPVLSDLAGYTCPIGYVLAYRGVMPDDSVGLCGSADEPADLTWCVPPWGAVPYCSWKECEPGLTQVYVADGNQLRKVCRNIPSA